MRRLRLKLILLFRSVPEDSIKLQELLETFGVIERFTPYDQSGRGALRTEEARKWLEDRRHEALAEFALLISMVAMLAAVVAMIAAISAGVQESEVLYFSAVRKGTVYLRIESTLPLDRSQPRDYMYALNLTID